jgi:alkaline phosphatase D
MTLVRLALLAFGLLSAVAQADEPPLRRIAFGSCLGQDGVQPIWRHVLAQKPDAFVFLGDNVYADTTDPVELRAAYAKLAAQPGYQALQKATRILATWDDHDYGANDAGADYPQKETSKQIFLDFFGVARDSPRRERDGVYHAEVFGPPGRRVQIILLDTRYNRSPLVWKEDEADRVDGGRYLRSTEPGATILGAKQWEWLEEQLRVPAQVRIIGSSIQVVDEDTTGETWANFPLERKRLFNLLWRATGSVFISGDRHFAELSMMDSEAGYPTYDLTSSSLNWSERMFRMPERNRHRVAVLNRGDNFGLIEIDWERRDPLLRFKIIDEDGEVMIHHKVELSVLRESNLPWWNAVPRSGDETQPGSVGIVRDAAQSH